MKRTLLLIVLAGLAGSLAGCSGSCTKRSEKQETPAAPPAEEWVAPEISSVRALWVWESPAITSASNRTELLEFCRAKKINTLYFYMGDFPDRQYDPEYVQGVKTLVQTVHASGMVIHALFGSEDRPRLARRENHYEAITLIRDFLKFNHAQAPRERFDGFLESLDPGRLPEWSENKDGMQEAFADLVLEFHRTVLEFDSELPLGWSLSIDFDQYEWLPRILENLKYVVIRDFSDDPETILEAASRELELAKEKGVQVVLGVLTQDLSARGGDLDKFTFQEEGADRLEAVLEEVSTRLKTNSAFAGVAIQEYESFKNLPPVRE